MKVRMPHDYKAIDFNVESVAERKMQKRSWSDWMTASSLTLFS